MRVHMPYTGFIVAVVAAITIGACSSGDSQPDADTASPTPDDGEHTGMMLDSAAMHQHAQETDSIVREMRQHAAQLREMAPDAWPARVDTHVERVAGMLAMMDRHMREMNMNMASDHEHMGEMMGMTAEEHTAMVADMAALRANAETLQTATAAQVRAVMPTHLDRLERMLSGMERSAAHMAGGAAMHSGDTAHDPNH